MRIRKAFVAVVIGALVIAPSAACGKGDKYETVTTDTREDCDQQDWDTRETDPESAIECRGKTGPDAEIDKPHKVKKAKKPKTSNTKKDTKPKTGTGNNKGNNGNKGTAPRGGGAKK